MRVEQVEKVCPYAPDMRLRTEEWLRESQETQHYHLWKPRGAGRRQRGH